MKKFLWGSASAAYQIEGACDADGKGCSVWDWWAHEPGRTYDGTNGDIATDHYNRYEEDIDLMSEMGLQTYRFSISWSRILPEGRGIPNEKGIAFYNKIIDLLVEKDIEPMITLYHWDLPLALEREYGGWVHPKVVDDFLEYAKLCFELFGDRVKYWIVMNEPNIFTSLGYQLKLHPPGLNDDSLYLRAFHHTVMAHAKTLILYKKMGYDGKIGSSIAYSPAYCKSNSEEDLLARDMFNAIGSHWYLDSYLKGIYPEKGLEYYEKKGILFSFSEEDILIMKKGACLNDFIGINYYQSATVAANPIDGVGYNGLNTSGKKGNQKENGIPGLFKIVRNQYVEYTDWDWTIDPDGLYFGLKELHERYGLPVVISENGLGAYDTLTEQEEVHDMYRIDFIKKHIGAMKKAMKEGVNVLAYCTWSFTDLLSWLNGYKKRYGFVYIDFEGKSLKRIRKDSFYWYKEIIEKNGEDL